MSRRTQQPAPAARIGRGQIARCAPPHAIFRRQLQCVGHADASPAWPPQAIDTRAKYGIVRHRHSPRRCRRSVRSSSSLISIALRPAPARPRPRSSQTAHIARLQLRQLRQSAAITAASPDSRGYGPSSEDDRLAVGGTGSRRQHALRRQFGPRMRHRRSRQRTPRRSTPHRPVHRRNAASRCRRTVRLRPPPPAGVYPARQAADMPAQMHFPAPRRAPAGLRLQ